MVLGLCRIVAAVIVVDVMLLRKVELDSQGKVK